MLFTGFHGAHEGSSVITEIGAVSLALAMSDFEPDVVVLPLFPL